MTAKRRFAGKILFAAAPALSFAGPATDAAPLSSVAAFEVRGLDSSALLAAAEAQDAAGAPYRFAEPVVAALEPEKNGTWEALADGSLLWRQVLSSEGALSLNVGFADFHLPPGAEAYLYSLDRKPVVGPLTEADNEPHGEYWSPIFPGDAIVVEVRVPADRRDELGLKIAAVNHGFRGFRRLVEKSGSCNVDVVCSQGDGWRDQIRSVAVYSLGGIFACTGALVNNTARDRRGFFLTADHCGINGSNAATLVAYWNFENSTCRTPGGGASGGNGDGSLAVFNTGAFLRAENSGSDVALIEFDDPVNPQADAYFAGWDRRDYIPQTAVCIHHPGTDEKRITFENDPLSITSQNSNPTPGDGNYLRVTDWDLGTTEPGSSGSPLFDGTTKRIVGQLWGGQAACGNNLSDWYGRVFRSWTGGGGNSSRLSNWLDSAGTGEEFLDGMGNVAIDIVAPVEIDDSIGGDGDGVLEPGESAVALLLVLRNTGSGVLENVSATVTTQTAGIVVDDGAGMFPNIPAGQTAALSDPVAISIPSNHPCGAPVQLTVAVDSSAVDADIVIVLPTGPACDVVPDLGFVSAAIADGTGNGNGNGVVDPGETTIDVVVTLANDGGDATPFQGTLSSESATVDVIEPNAAWPAVAEGAQGANSTPFRIAVDPAHDCGLPLELSLAVEGEDFVATIPVQIPTGPASIVAARSVAGSVPILDLATATAPIAFSETGVVESVEVTLNATHTYLADLEISLVGPTGTTVLLMADRGGANDNLVNTNFSDAAAQPVSAGAAPFTGSFRPEQPLAAFAGNPINGTWTISVFDDADADEGTLNANSGVSVRYVPACAAPKTLDPAWRDDTAGKTLASGDTIDLGTAIGGTPVSHEIEATNGGTGTLLLSDLQVSAGFEIVGGGDTAVPPGGTFSFAVRMLAGAAGQKAGTLQFSTNDPNQPTVTFNLQGEVICPEGNCPNGDIMVITESTDVWYSTIVACAFAPAERMSAPFASTNHDLDADEVALFADANNDGLTDVIAVSDQSSLSGTQPPVPPTGRLFVAYSQGDGSMGPPVSNSQGWSIDKDPTLVKFVALDWNADGMTDLFQVGNESLSFALNSMGIIGNPTTVAVPGLAMGAGIHVASGDVNGDGFGDLIHLDNATGAIRVLRGTATSPATQVPTLDVLLEASDFRHDPDAKQAIVVADFDGDGMDDVAFVQEASEGVPNVRAALANGTTLDAPTTWADRLGFHADPSRTLGWWVFAMDLDCDGKADLLQQTEFQTLWVARSNGAGFDAPFPVAGLGYRHKPEGPWQMGMGNAI